MHPPFIFTDHKVRPNTHLHPKPKRGDYTPLNLHPTPACWPPLPLVQVVEPQTPVDQLRIVPVPKRTIKDRIGRWLIRTGQRMILEHSSG